MTDSSFEAGVAAATAEQAAEVAEDAQQEAETAQATAEAALETAAAASGEAFDARLEVDALRAEMSDGFAGIHSRLDELATAGKPAGGDTPPAPEPKEPPAVSEEGEKREDKPRQGLGMWR